MNDLLEVSDKLKAPFVAFKGNWKAVLPHWHYFTEIIYLVSGILYAEIEGKQVKMHSGDMMLFHPKQIHSFLDYNDSENNGEELLFYVIKFDGMILSNTIPGSPNLIETLAIAKKSKEISGFISSSEFKNTIVKLYFEECIREIEHKEFGYDIRVASIISLIITEIIRTWIKKGLKFSSKVSYDQFQSKDFSVLEYIDTHSAENINIEKLAAKCGMCYSNFAKQFKTQFGRTCKEYIEFIRICKADTLLLYTNKTLDFISQETGFTDASHFIRTYKKFRGITPKQRRFSKYIKL